MALLKKVKWEKFAQGMVRGESPAKAYVSAGYSPKGAAQSARNLLKNTAVSARILELRQIFDAGVMELEICERNQRIKALQNRWDLMRRIIDDRGKNPEFAEIPGGKTGLLMRDYKGKDANQPIYRVDTGLLAELRLHEKQAAQELGQWSEERDQGSAIEGERFTGTMEELLVLYRRVSHSSA